MSERPKHQLAAVLFADIVGYTSIMQSDEQTALLKLQNFKLILEQKVTIHKGEIICCNSFVRGNVHVSCYPDSKIKLLSLHFIK